MKGKVILVVGPSGSGKGTLIAHALEAHPDFVFPISATTRSPRPGEQEGVNYYYVSKDEFARKIDQGELLEWAEYGGNFYGTPLSEVVPVIERGGFALHDIEVQGARNVLAMMPEDAIAIYVDAGSWEALEERIKARAPISDEELAKRRERYADEVTFKEQASYVVMNENGKLEEAKAAFMAAIDDITKHASQG